MSTWINRAAPALCLLLAACVVPGGGGGGGVSTSRSVLGGAIRVALPAGYCIDDSASRDTGEAALVIAGRCAADRPVPAAAITVSVGGDGSSAILKTGAQALSDWARSPAGRAALARDGNGASVVVRETLVSGGVFLIRLEDRATGPYWRAALGLHGHLVMISVSPPAQGELPSEAGRAILDSVIASVKRANSSGP